MVSDFPHQDGAQPVAGRDPAGTGTPEAVSRPMTVAITGASGFIGSALAARLTADGHRVRRLVRSTQPLGEHDIRFDAATGQVDQDALEAVDAVVNLAGENLSARRWNRSVKQRILDSRVQTTQQLARTLATLQRKPAVLLSGSAVGIYGHRGDEYLHEDCDVGDGFLADVCHQWEAAAQPAGEAGIRTVFGRIGVVLHPAGGALRQMLTPFKLGVGGVIGGGWQYISWITRNDIIRAICFALTHPQLEGPVNLVSPQPLTNRELTKTLGRVLRRPTILPMPAFLARLAFGEMADEALLASQRVQPRKLEHHGFIFEDADLETALRAMLDRPAPA